MNELRRLTDLIVNQVSHWSSARWGPRGDALYDIIARIAGPEHRLPRLDNVVLPDQLRVVVADLLETGDQAGIAAAVEALADFRGIAAPPSGGAEGAA